VQAQEREVGGGDDALDDADLIAEEETAHGGGEGHQPAIKVAGKPLELVIRHGVVGVVGPHLCCAAGRAAARGVVVVPVEVNVDD
jgi:hypothetical protein